MPPPLNAAERGFLRRGESIPLIALMDSLVRHIDDRLRELMAEAGFDDLRPAHNAILVNLPSEGLRLTDLAAVAGMSKQAMAELVDDLVAKRYVRRVPDPTDGRAKLIVWAKRGEASHPVAMAAFRQIEAELAEVVGAESFRRLRATLGQLFFTVIVGSDGADPGH